MLRTLFLAIGVGLLFLGFEALVLDHAVLATDSPIGKAVAAKTEPVFDEYGFEVQRKVIQPSKKTLSPPEWAPWSMLSSGSILMIYSLAGRFRRSTVSNDDE